MSEAGSPVCAPRADRRAALVSGVLLLAGLGTAGLRAQTGAVGELRILMLGDSLTSGHGLAARDALPARLQAALRERGLDVRVINAGVSGDTTAGGLARLEWALADRPHAVIVALGANDALRAIDPAHVRSNLDRLLGALRSAAFRCSSPGCWRRATSGGATARASTRSTRISPPGTVRSSTPSCWTASPPRPPLNQADGLHPNAAGVAVIVRRILPSVLRLVRLTGPMT